MNQSTKSYLRSALIGTGRIAREHLNAIVNLDIAELIAVCDLSPTLAQATAESFNLSQWFVDYEHMFSELNPDVVHITTPADTHLKIASDALKSGIHVIVEKPIVMKREDLEYLIALASENNLYLIEDHNYLFNKPFQTILHLLKKGEFGSYIDANILFSLGGGAAERYVDPDFPHPAQKLAGGVLGDFLPHLAYLSNALLGSAKLLSSSWNQLDSSSSISSDEMYAILESEHGKVKVGVSFNDVPIAFRISVKNKSNNGCIEANLFQNTLVIKPDQNKIPFASFIENSSYICSKLDSIWHRATARPVVYQGLHDFINRAYIAIATGSSPPVSIKAMRDTLDLTLTLAEQNI